MKKVLIFLIVLISVVTLAQEYDELFNSLLSRSDDFVSFSGAGFEARFVPAYAATDFESKVIGDQNLLGILIVRSTRVMDLEVNNVAIIDSESEERVSYQIYKVEDLSVPLQLPFSLPSGGVLVLTSKSEVQDYFMDIRIQQILLPWRVKTTEPGKIVEMAPVTLDETPPVVDVQETYDYDSIVEGMADLNDRLNFLQDNVEGLNLQFRRLNTLFLDTQVALAEYKAAVDRGAFDIEEFAVSIENRLVSLEDAVVDNPVLRIEFEELSDSLERLYLSLVEWSDEISRIETLAASQSHLKDRVNSLQDSIEDVRASAAEQTDSAVISSINEKIDEISEVLSAMEYGFEELENSVEKHSGEIESIHERLVMELDTLDNRFEVVEAMFESNTEAILNNSELLNEVALELDGLSKYVSEISQAQMERVSSLSETLLYIEERVSATELSLAALEEIRARLTASESTAKTLSNRIDTLEEHRSSIEGTLEVLVEKIEDLEIGVFGTGAINFAELETEILELRGIADSLSRGFVRFNSDLISLGESIPPAGVSIETFGEAYDELTGSIVDLNSELLDVRTLLVNLDRSIELLEESLEVVSVDLDSMKGNFDGSVAAIDSNLKAIQRLQNDLSKTKEELAATAQELRSLSSELTAVIVTRDEITEITEEAVKRVGEETAREIASLKRTNNIWLTVAVISSLAALVLGIINILP